MIDEGKLVQMDLDMTDEEQELLLEAFDKSYPNKDSVITLDLLSALPAKEYKQMKLCVMIKTAIINALEMEDEDRNKNTKDI